VVLTFSAFFHTIRIFGGTAGAIYRGPSLLNAKSCIRIFGTSRQQWRLAHSSNHSWDDRRSLCQSSGLATAGARAVDLIAARVRLQAFSLSIIDGFLLIAWSCVCALILVALLRQSPLNYGDLSPVQPTLAREKESK